MAADSPILNAFHQYQMKCYSTSRCSMNVGGNYGLFSSVNLTSISVMNCLVCRIKENCEAFNLGFSAAQFSANM